MFKKLYQICIFPFYTSFFTLFYHDQIIKTNILKILKIPIPNMNSNLKFAKKSCYNVQTRCLTLKWLLQSVVVPILFRNNLVQTLIFFDYKKIRSTCSRVYRF